MRNYLLILNCKDLAYFRSYERALAAFRRGMLRIDTHKDVLELYQISTGHRCASSI